MGELCAHIFPFFSYLLLFLPFLLAPLIQSVSEPCLDTQLPYMTLQLQQHFAFLLFHEIRFLLKNKIAQSGSSDTCPICIWLSNNANVNKSTSKWPFDVYKDPNDCMPMALTRRVTNWQHWQEKMYLVWSCWANLVFSLVFGIILDQDGFPWLGSNHYS